MDPFNRPNSFHHLSHGDSYDARHPPLRPPIPSNQYQQMRPKSSFNFVPRSTQGQQKLYPNEVVRSESVLSVQRHESQHLNTTAEKMKAYEISHLCHRIKGLYDMATADVKFIFNVNGTKEVVPAHKSILAFNSPVFRQMFYGELKEKGDVRLTDTTFDAFVNFIKSICGLWLIIEGSQSEMSQLVHLAHKCDVNWLEEKCKEILIEIINDDMYAILWILPLANLYSFDGVRQKCIDEILLRGNLIIESVEFADCEKEVMKEILGTGFWLRDEVKVFETCITWARRTCEKAGLDSEFPENIREQLGDVFDLIRFESMSQYHFLECLRFNSGLFTCDEIQRIVGKVLKVNQDVRQDGTFQQNLSIKSKSDVKIKEFKIRNKSSLQSFFEDQNTADVSFVIKNGENGGFERLSAHKCMLANKSVVFRDQFKHPNSLNEEIIIVQVPAEPFKQFLRLIYVSSSSQMNPIMEEIDDQNVDVILSIAEKYRVYYIAEQYMKHLIRTLNEKNVIWRFELSRTHSLARLEYECVDLMKLKSSQIIASESFIETSQRNIKAILELRIWDNEESLAELELIQRCQKIFAQCSGMNFH